LSPSSRTATPLDRRRASPPLAAKCRQAVACSRGQRPQGDSKPAASRNPRTVAPLPVTADPSAPASPCHWTCGYQGRGIASLGWCRPGGREAARCSEVGRQRRQPGHGEPAGDRQAICLPGVPSARSLARGFSSPVKQGEVLIQPPHPGQVSPAFEYIESGSVNRGPRVLPRLLLIFCTPSSPRRIAQQRPRTGSLAEMAPADRAHRHTLNFWSGTPSSRSERTANTSRSLQAAGRGLVQAESACRSCSVGETPLCQHLPHRGGASKLDHLGQTQAGRAIRCCGVPPAGRGSGNPNRPAPAAGPGPAGPGRWRPLRPRLAPQLHPGGALAAGIADAGVKSPMSRTAVWPGRPGTARNCRNRSAVAEWMVAAVGVRCPTLIRRGRAGLLCFGEPRPMI